LGLSNIVGNFGVVLMIGGNISSRRRVMSTAIFDYIETMQWREANILAGGMGVFAFVVIPDVPHPGAPCESLDMTAKALAGNRSVKPLLVCPFDRLLRQHPPSAPRISELGGSL
jgi:hypothetical protein